MATNRSAFSATRLALTGMSVLLAAAPSALAQSVELDGNVVVDTAPMIDWTSLFVVDAAPDGTVTGAVSPLPTGGILTAFRRDEVSVSGLDRNDCSVFGRGNKNTDPISTWEAKSGSVPSNDDLSNVMAYLREDAEGSLELFLGVERYAENGESHIGLEINQQAVRLSSDGSGDACPGKASFIGQRTLNDLLVAVDFERGGSIGLVRVFRYLDETTLELLIEETVDTTELFCNNATSAAGLDIPANTICAINNDVSIDGGPWANFNRSNNTGPVQSLPVNAFTEIGIKLGNLPGQLGQRSCIRSLNLTTRTSPSVSSSLKDFSLIRFDSCAALSGGTVEVSADGTCGTEVAPISGWEVRVLDESGDLVTTNGSGQPLTNPACTDESGEFLFDELLTGEPYTVCLLVPDRITGENAENFNWRICDADGTEITSGGDVESTTCPVDRGGELLCFPPAELGGDAGIEFSVFRDVIECEFSLGVFCDTDGNGTQSGEGEEFLDDFCVCVSRLVDGTPDSSTAVCGVTSGGTLTADLDTGFTYRAEVDLDGSSCGSADRSGEWAPSNGFADIFLNPDSPTGCEASFGVTTIPVITCPADVEGECGAGGDFGTATATNECGPVSVGSSDEIIAGCGETVTVERTWTATSGAGATSTCVQTIVTTDTEPPVITCPADVVFECDAVGEFGTAAATDNCGEATITGPVEERTPGLCPQEETVRRTFTATDSCELTSECTQTVEIVDTTAPVVTCPDDLAVQCGEEPPDFGAPTIIDNCDPTPTVRFDDVILPGDCTGEGGTGGNIAGIAPPPKFSIQRTYTVSDGSDNNIAATCGNVATCVQIIDVFDAVPPTLTCPPDMTIECGDEVDFGEPVATDGCASVTVDGPFVTETPICGGSKTISRTFVATDECNNQLACTQTIQVLDTTAPTIECPADQVFECDNVGEFAQATASDGCGDVVITETQQRTPGLCPLEETVVRTITATDECGLTATCMQTVEIVDTTPPVVTCPPDLVVECGDEPDFGQPTISDNCDPTPTVILEEVIIPGTCDEVVPSNVAGIAPPPKFSIQRTYTISDGAETNIAGATCNNVSVCVQIIDVLDSTPPQITPCPTDTEVACRETFPFNIQTSDSCEGSITVECFFSDAAEPDRFTAVQTGENAWEVTPEGSTSVQVVCISTDECNNTSTGCVFDVSASCDQACSPGFWKNNLEPWCLTPFSPLPDFCEAGPATLFLDAFQLDACPGAPRRSSYRDDITLLEAVNSSGGPDQVLFHGSAALLSSYAIGFIVPPNIVRDIMRDACTGTRDYDGSPMSWNRAADIFIELNAIEQVGGCPLTGSTSGEGLIGEKSQRLDGVR